MQSNDGSADSNLDGANVREFDSQRFATELGSHLGLELCKWSVYLNGLVRIRAFALSVEPQYGEFHPSLLTDHEIRDHSKWAIPDWRFYDITCTPNCAWPYGENLGKSVQEYVANKEECFVHPKFAYWAQAKEDFDVLLACAHALKEPDFLTFLNRLELTDDFELGVFHVHDENAECNFALERNQDLSVLTRYSI